MGNEGSITFVQGREESVFGRVVLTNGKWLERWLKFTDGVNTIWLADAIDMHHFSFTCYLISPSSKIPEDKARVIMRALRVWAHMGREDKSRAVREAWDRHPAWPRSPMAGYDWQPK
jgi:hypothetical protein